MQIVFLAILASVSVVSASATCADSSIEELVSRTSCGSGKSITQCLQKDVDIKRLEEVEQCFIAGGCSSEEAVGGAVWFAYECGQYGFGKNDLKKRADSTTADTSVTDTTTSAETTAKSTTKTSSTSAKSSTTTVASTSATTTSSSSNTASSSASSTASTASSTSSSSTSTSSGSSSTSSSTGTSSSTLQCSVTSTKSTSACSTVSGSKTCTATTTEIASCSPGFLCFSATAGADVCMKKDDTLTTSGLAVTITFAIGLSLAILGIIITAVKGKQKTKAEEKARLMAEANMANNSGRDIEAAQAFTRTQQPNRSEANIPLISSEGPRSDVYSEQPDGYSGNAPQLHSGLGALGQEPETREAKY